ncbi:hypothetical protein [Pseudoalteromonas sp. SCSIO 43088]|nr:hypothetical protein [Pseudoalteromonas sp. SCSIO 43088]
MPKPNSHWLKDELEQLKQSLSNFDYHLLERNKDGDATDMADNKCA